MPSASAAEGAASEMGLDRAPHAGGDLLPALGGGR